jgi:hypothetical protein
LKVFEVASGGGTDAAFAAPKTIEGFRLSSYGAHSNDAEYVKLESIVPRLYLSALDHGCGAAQGEMRPVQRWFGDTVFDGWWGQYRWRSASECAVTVIRGPTSISPQR